MVDERREELAGHIREHAVAWCIAKASVEEIDTINILQASLLAMQRAVRGLSVLPALALVDGNQPPPLTCAVQCVIGGDGRSLSIAAASSCRRRATPYAGDSGDEPSACWGFVRRESPCRCRTLRRQP